MNRFRPLSVCVLTLVMTVAFGAFSEPEIKAEDYCPTLTSANLAEAACSTPTKLFKTDPASVVGYFAEPICPWGMTTRKWLQSWKSDKTYKGTVFDHQDGEVKCTYNVPMGKWRKFVNGRALLNVVMIENSTELVNYWADQSHECPNLAASDVYHLASPLKDKEPKATLTVKNGDKKLALTLLAPEPLNFNAMKSEALPSGYLEGGKRSAKAPFWTMCEYIYHKGSEEKTFQLRSKIVKQ